MNWLALACASPWIISMIIVPIWFAWLHHKGLLVQNMPEDMDI
jgi:hypothetical protein